MKVTQIDTPLQLLQRLIRRQSFDLHPVGFRQFVPRVADSRLQCAIVGHHDQAFRVGIQSACGIHIGNGNKIGKRQPAVWIRKLGQDSMGFVEQDQAAQLAQSLPELLQKRSDSG